VVIGKREVMPKKDEDKDESQARTFSLRKSVKTPKEEKPCRNRPKLCVALAL